MTAVPEESPRKIRMRVTITAEYEADPAPSSPAGMAEADQYDLTSGEVSYDEFLKGLDVTVEVVPLVAAGA